MTARRRGHRRVIAPATHEGDAAEVGDSGEAAGSAVDPAGDEVSQTRDDTDLGWGDAPAGAGLDESWWRSQRPPHWQ